ncbi:MAG: hypothetical protein Q9185_006481 [Variospora sp. 1 TL-2023]
MASRSGLQENSGRRSGAPGAKSTSATETTWRAKITRKFARMQYRRDETADWVDVGNAWLQRPKHDPHPERWNVQQGIGIDVCQYDDKYDRQINLHSQKDIKQSYYGWKVSFPLAMLYQIHFEEYETDSWADNADLGATRSIYVIRFKCVGQPTGCDVSEFPRPPVVSEMAVDPKPVTAGTAAEGSGAAAIRPDQFPLAVLCPELEGMYLRLAFDKGPKTGKKPASVTRPDVWAWPMIATVLTGRPWAAVEIDINKAPLNEWARATGGQFATGALREVKEVGEGEDRVEWLLEQQAGARPLMSQTPGPPAQPGQSGYGTQSTYRGPRTYERSVEYPAPPDFGTPRQYIGPQDLPALPQGPPAFGQGLPALAHWSLPARPVFQQNLKKREREAVSIEQLEADKAEKEQACFVSDQKVQNAKAAVSEAMRALSAAQAALSAAKAEDGKNRDELIDLAREAHARRGGH